METDNMCDADCVRNPANAPTNITLVDFEIWRKGFFP